MKRIFTILMVIASIATVTTIASCTKTETDKCATVVCKNGGTCTDGTCACTAGYEGTNCDSVSRTKFITSYTASETKNAGTPYSYSGTIIAGTAINEVKIDRIPNAHNFFNTNVVATVSGKTLTIANQNPDGDAYYVTGSGTLNAAGTVLTLNYTVSGPNSATPPVVVTDTYVSTWTK